MRQSRSVDFVSRAIAIGSALGRIGGTKRKRVRTSLAPVLVVGVLATGIVAGVASPAFAVGSLKYTSAVWVGGVPYGGTGNLSGITVTAAGYADSTPITFSFTSPSTCPANVTLGNGTEPYSSTSSSYGTTTSASGGATAVIYEPGTDASQSATECVVQAVANLSASTPNTDTITIQTDPVFTSAASATVWAPDDNPVNESINGSTGFDHLNFDVIAVGNGITTIDDTGGLAGLGTVSGFSGGSCADPITLATDEIECVLSGTPSAGDAGPTGSLATGYPDTLSATDTNSNTGDQSFTLDVNPAPQCDIDTSGTDAADVLSGTVDPDITTGNADDLNDGGAVISASGSANTAVYIGCNPTISGDDALMVPASPLADVIGSTTTASVPPGTKCYNGVTESGGTCPSNGGESEGGEGTITILIDNLNKITKWTTGATSSNSPTSAASTAFDGTSTIPDPSNFASSVGYSSLTGDENPDVPADGGAAECPPQPALVDAGLPFCESEPVSDNGDTYYTDQVYVDYSSGTDTSGFSQGTTPNSPVLDLNGSSSTEVSSENLSTPVTLGDNSCDSNITVPQIDNGSVTPDCWWNNADDNTSAGNNYSTSTTDLSASDVTLTGGSLNAPTTLEALGGTANDLQVTPTSYTEGWYDDATPADSTLNTGYLTPPELSGSITLPADLGAGDYTVTLDEPQGSTAGDGDAYLDPSGISASATLQVYSSTSSTMSTPTDPTIGLGDSNTDVATVTGAVNGPVPTGSVDFYTCPENVSPCTPTTPGAVADPNNPVALNGGSATSTSFTPDSTGTWCYAAVYSGDSNYTGSSDESTDGCFTVSASAAPINSTPTHSSIVLGNTNTDGAVVTGGAAAGSPTGTVSFYECGATATPEPCTSQANQLGSAVSLTSGAGDTSSANSVTFTPHAGGYYCFGAYYSGDSNYSATSDTGTNECFDVTSAASTTSSTPASNRIAIGSTNSDNVTVAGNSVGSAPLGTVDFYECGSVSGPAPCTSMADPVGSASLTAGAGDVSYASSASITFNSAGTYCFGVYYLGSSSASPPTTNYSASHDTATTECFVVGELPTITSFAPASGPVGTTITIKGTNLSSPLSVTIDGVAATIKSSTATRIKVTVAAGDHTGKIKVTTASGSVKSATPFTVT
jgi:hypothetical protein